MAAPNRIQKTVDDVALTGGKLLGGAKPEPDLDNILSDAEARGVKLSVQQGNQGLRLSRIEVPKEDRSKGLGTEIMEKLANYADATGQRISLTPSSDFGGSVPRLKTFYGRHGFTPNTGKSRDLSISDTMIREPVVITPETDGQ
jgi:GNAT superfamily N-acetyltransferase